MRLDKAQLKQWELVWNELREIVEILRPRLPEGALADTDHMLHFAEYGEASANLYATCRLHGSFHGQRDRLVDLMRRLGETPFDG